MNNFIIILTSFLTALWVGLASSIGLYSLRNTAFLLAALAAAAAGTVLVRWRLRWTLIGLIYLIFVPWGSAVLCGLAAGGVAALPPGRRSDHFRGIFGLTLALVMLGLYFGGIDVLFNPMLMRWCIAALAASAFLIWTYFSGGPAKLIPVIFLIAFTVLPGAILGRQVSYSGNSGGRIEAYSGPSENEGELITAARHYKLPRDLTRFEASALIASLLSGKEEQKILFLGEIPATVTEHLRSFRWVDEVDIYLNAGTYGKEQFTFPEYLRRQERAGRKYDLIFIAELPASRAEARRELLHYLAGKLLAPGGVLIVPQEYDDGLLPFAGKSIRLPGSNGSLLARSPSPEKLSVDLGELDRRLVALQRDDSDPLLAPGALPILYSLPTSAVPRESHQIGGAAAMDQWSTRARSIPQLPLALAVLGGLYLLARFWVGRLPGVTTHFAAIELGTAAAMLAWSAADYLADRQFFTDYAIGLLPGLVLLALPDGRGKFNFVNLLPVWLTAGVMVFNWPWALMLLPLGLWLAVRNLRHGFKPPDAQLFYCGAIIGTMLFLLLDPPSTWIAAALLPMPRLLRL
ncbi:MAG: hypothetical protein AB7F32_10795 [Victivallaceae bacterium]